MPLTASAVRLAPAAKDPAAKAPARKLVLPKPSAVKGVDTWVAGSRFRLSAVDPASAPLAPDDDRDKTEKATAQLRKRLLSLHGRLIGEKSRSVLVVLQAMDGGGKDGTVKSLYFGLNPADTSVHSFGVPSEEEMAHDFLWRIHACTPRRGTIGIFNRSHYEDVLAVRVRNIAPKSVWEPRFDTINDFERGLHASGTTVVKIMLHISLEEQGQRLQARIDRPDKRWKFRTGDLEDRVLWSDYQDAYQDTIRRTSTEHAPWYVVPADKKWYRDFATLTIVVNTLEAMQPEYPARPELDGIVVP
jgi:PPK2 family polyphosphate:nucleotide phosphotransferase